VVIASISFPNFASCCCRSCKPGPGMADALDNPTRAASKACCCTVVAPYQYEILRELGVQACCSSSTEPAVTSQGLICGWEQMPTPCNAAAALPQQSMCCIPCHSLTQRLVRESMKARLRHPVRVGSRLQTNGAALLICL
jgi:hypothetical protein